jgi:putative protein kinase ArgK-like GTPase of G3E family
VVEVRTVRDGDRRAVAELFTAVAEERDAGRAAAACTGLLL